MLEVNSLYLPRLIFSKDIRQPLFPIGRYYLS
jgi:hypothetical protein